MKDRVVEILAQWKAGATACPGDVARQLGTNQRMLRPVLAEMAESGAIAVGQRGAPGDLVSLRRPDRIRLRR